MAMHPGGSVGFGKKFGVSVRGPFEAENRWQASSE